MAYTDFNLEEVLGSEERTRYQTFAEVNHETLQRSLKDFVMNLLAKAYEEAVGNDINAFGDYQSAKMVVPANKVRTAIYENIPYFYSILGCIGPEETPAVSVELYAYAGGKSGLYISAIIKGLRDVEYKYLYPEIVEEEEDPTDESLINVQFTCIGCEVTEIEKYDAGGVAITVGLDEPTAESDESVIIGSHIVYHVEPELNYTVSRVVIDGAAYTELKKLNDIPGITVAEYSLGYEFILTDTSADHNIIFVCEYDNVIVTNYLDVTAINCTGVFYDNPRLTPYAVGTNRDENVKLSVLSGEMFKVSFTPVPYTQLAHIIIDGRDYIDEYEEGQMFHYDGRTADNNVFEIDITGSVTISIPSVGMNHTIKVEYVAVKYRIRGFITNPTGDTLAKFIDTEIENADTITTSAANAVILGYDDYQYSRFVVRDPETFRTLSVDAIDVSFYPYDGNQLRVAHPTCDADIYILLEDKPLTCTITGEVVNGSIFYNGDDNTNHTTTVITTEPIEYGNSAIFRIKADENHMFTQQSPNFGASILIDGEAPDMAVLGANNIELAYVNESTIMIGFLNLNKDHTFRVAVNTEKPKYDLVFTGSHTINGETNENAIQTTILRVKTEDTTTRNYYAASGFEIPITPSQMSDLSGELDLTKCEIFVNSITVENISAIPTKYGNAKVSFSLGTESLIVEVTEVTGDTTVIFNLKEGTKLPEEYNVTVNATGCQVDNKTSNSKTVTEGDSATFHITAAEDKLIPLDENDLLDFNMITMSLSKDGNTTTVITPDNFPTNMSFVYSNNEAVLVITDVDADYVININMEYPPDPVMYTVNVVETNVTIEQENPTQVEEGSDLDIVIDANKGTTFQNMMFILDKGTDHSYSWAIDLDQNSFNIFDKEIEGVPQVENDGTVVRTREGDHYVYTVHLKDIRNNYEIRFSTVNIDVGQ